MIEQYIEHLDIDGFQRDLIQWYHSVKRDLPWRINQDPYRILVSEITRDTTASKVFLVFAFAISS